MRYLEILERAQIGDAISVSVDPESSSWDEELEWQGQFWLSRSWVLLSRYIRMIPMKFRFWRVTGILTFKVRCYVGSDSLNFTQYVDLVSKLVGNVSYPEEAGP
jgi:hypothetical protein